MALMLWAAPGPVIVERHVLAMGTQLEVRVDAAEEAVARDAAERAIRAVERVERRLTTWQADSELSRLNASATHVAIPISTELARDLELALRCARETGGAFDPTVGALVSAWGLRHGGRQPSPDERRAARRAVGASYLTVTETSCIKTRRVVVEEGGFAKGIALDAALSEVGAHVPGASVMLDLGGQVAVSHGRRTVVALADPRDRTRGIGEIVVSAGSLATSANSERSILVSGVPRGHILDPRSGEPAEDFGALTVWAPTAAAADCLSTGLYVLGPRAALAWAQDHPEIGVVVVETTPAGLRVRASERLRSSLRVRDAEIEWTGRIASERSRTP